jgi:hypothetical protein
VGALWAQRTLISVPRLASPFIMALCERGPTAIHDRRPRSGRVSDRETDPEIDSKEITFLTTHPLTENKISAYMRDDLTPKGDQEYLSLRRLGLELSF